MTATPPPEPRHRDTSTKRGRATTGTSQTWTVAVLFLVVLVPLVIFLVQNTAGVTVSFVSLHGRMPLGVAMLLSAVGGALLVSLAAAARIWQLRRMNRRR